MTSRFLVSIGMLLATLTICSCSKNKSDDPRGVILEEKTARIRRLALSPQGNLLASGGEDGVVKVWDVRKRKVLWEKQGDTGFLQGLAFSPEGDMLVSLGQVLIPKGTKFGAPRFLSQGGTIRIWNIKQSKFTKVIQTKHQHSSAAFSPDGKIFAAGGMDRNRSIFLWAVPDWKLLASLKGHRNAINSLAFCKGGKWLVSGSGDGTAKIWDVKSRKVVRTFQAAPVNKPKK